MTQEQQIYNAVQIGLKEWSKEFEKKMFNKIETLEKTISMRKHTINEAIEISGKSYKQIREAIVKGKLKAARTGRKHYINHSDLMEWNNGDKI